MSHELPRLLPSRPTLLAFALSRFVVLAAAIGAETVVERNPRLTVGTDLPLLRSLTAWDGWWYLGIAREGYQAAPLFDGYANVAFWPLYPLAVRVLSFPWPDLDALVAVVLSNLAFFIALGLVERLGTTVVGQERAIRGASFLALSPFGSVFSMAYPESLFLLFVVASCLAAERGRWPLAAVLVALATLTRFQGLTLLPTLVWIALRRQDPGRWPRLAWLGLGPVAALGFLAFVAAVTGRPEGYLEAQAGWGRAGIAPGPDSLGANLDWRRAAQLATFLGGTYLLVFARPDRLAPSYLLWPITALALTFASGNLVSVGRHLSVAVPFFWLLAGRGSWLGRIAWPIASTAGLFAIAVLSFAGWYVP